MKKMSLGETKKFVDGQNVKIAGIITNVKKKITKNNTLMAFVTIEDYYGIIEILVFEKIYNKCAFCIEKEKIVLVEGRLSIRDDEKTIIIANNFKEIINEDSDYKKININITNFSEEKKELLRNEIRKHAKLNNAVTKMEVTINGEIRDCGFIYMDHEIKDKFKLEFGEENIKIN